MTLTVLALVSGAQFHGDAFGHFDQASRRAGDLRYLVLDTWTRPLPNLLFWLAGPLGVERAFLVPLALTLCTVALVHRLLHRLLGAGSAVLVLPLFLIQRSVLETGYLTLTEVPCVLAVAASLALFHGSARARPLAYLVAGTLPLCRTEGILVALAFAGAALWVERRTSGGPRPGGVLVRLALLGAPLVLWLGTGAALTGDPMWYLHANTYRGVASVRTGPALWIALCNGVTMLPRLLPMPLLPFLCAGLLTPGAQARARNASAAPVLAMAATQFFVLSAVRTGPDEWSDFHAAGLPRMYAAAAPALALAAAAGLRVWWHDPGARPVRLGWVLAALVVLAGFPFDVLEHAGAAQVPEALFRRTSQGAAPADALATLGTAMAHDRHWLRYILVGGGGLVLCLVLFLPPVHRVARRIAAAAHGRRAPLAAAVLALLLVPWFPFTPGRLIEPRQPALQRLACLHAFGAWYRQHHAESRPDVIQQEVHDLRPFCGFADADPRAPDMTWRWGHELRGARKATRAGTLFLAGFAQRGSTAEADLRARFAADPAFVDRSFVVDAEGREMVAVVFAAK